MFKYSSLISVLPKVEKLSLSRYDVAAMLHLQLKEDHKRILALHKEHEAAISTYNKQTLREYPWLVYWYHETSLKGAK